MAVVFDEPEIPRAVRSAEPRVGRITKLVLKTGIAKNVRDAQIMMTVVAVLVIIFSVYLLISSYQSTKPVALTPAERQKLLEELNAPH